MYRLQHVIRSCFRNTHNLKPKKKKLKKKKIAKALWTVSLEAWLQLLCYPLEGNRRTKYYDGHALHKNAKSQDPSW